MRLIFLMLFSLSVLFSPIAKATRQSDYPISGTASTPQMDVFDRNFIAFMKKWQVPGASVAIMRDGKVIALRGYGWANLDQHEPVKPDSVFRIASVSKTITAVTILKLVQDGKLKLNDKVFAILDDLRPLPGKTINPKINQITVLNLLQMSSGWFTPGAHYDPMFGPWPKSVKNLLSPELPASCETTARLMMSSPLRSKPGTSYVYSNLDYCVLGLIVNKVTGSRYGYSGYENYVKTNILQPLNIQNMAIGSTQSKYQKPNEVHYYGDYRLSSAEELANSSYLPYSSMEILKKNFSNGGWVATAKDLATFVQAVKHQEVLRADLFNWMQAKPAYVSAKTGNYYGMGGRVQSANGQRYWIQTGSFTGTNALIVTQPNDTTIAVIFNYRPATYTFLHRFRPELRTLLVRSNV